jgi:hypothetical protein
MSLSFEKNCEHVVENPEVRYVPQCEINCVWVVDNHDKDIYLVGQVPRVDLREEDMDLPDWVYTVRECNGKQEKIYSICVGPISQFLAQWISKKVNKNSFEITGMKVY